MPFEDDFSHALRETAEASPPARLGLLATGAAERGRRRRRRRALTVGVATVAAVACVGVLALQLRPAGLDRSTGPASAAPAASASAGSATAAASPSAATGTAELLAALRSRLPAGLQASRPMTSGGPSGAHGGVMTAAYTVTDGTATGGVEVTVNRLAAGALPADAGGCEAGITGCTSVTQPDGARLTIHRPARAPGGEQLWDAYLRRPDGTMVTVSAGNIPGPGTGLTEPYPNGPLLTGDQLGALALDPVWRPFAASLPVH